MRVQLDNYTKDNKKKLAYWSLLVAKCIFKEVFTYFLLVGYTIDNIDAFSEWWSKKMHENSFIAILVLMKLYMDLDKVVG